MTCSPPVWTLKDAYLLNEVRGQSSFGKPSLAENLEAVTTRHSNGSRENPANSTTR